MTFFITGPFYIIFNLFKFSIGKIIGVPENEVISLNTKNTSYAHVYLYFY